VDGQTVSFVDIEVAAAPVTYLLARDEDCENSFHSSADFVSSISSQWHYYIVVCDPVCFPKMNMLLTKLVHGFDWHETQVMLFDKHPDGPFHELIKQAFSPNYDVIRASNYRNKQVTDSHLLSVHFPS
jgi:hypothetical protein